MELGCFSGFEKSLDSSLQLFERKERHDAFFAKPGTGFACWNCNGNEHGFPWMFVLRKRNDSCGQEYAQEIQEDFANVARREISEESGELAGKQSGSGLSPNSKGEKVIPTIEEIKREVEGKGSFYFSPQTMRFFHQDLSDFKVAKSVSGRIFIYAFSTQTSNYSFREFVNGELREVNHGAGMVTREVIEDFLENN